MRKLLAALGLVLALAGPAPAATYYVRATASGAGNGLTNSDAGAWKFEDVRSKSLSAGDIVEVQPGTYTGRHPTAFYGLQLGYKAGASGNPIIYRCAVRRTCIIDGGNESSRTYLVSFPDGRYLTFEGFVLQNGYSAGVGIWKDDTNDPNTVVINDIELKDSGAGDQSPGSTNHTAIFIERTSTNITVKNSYIHDIGSIGSSVKGHCIYLAGGNGARIINNVCRRPRGYGFQVEPYANIDDVKIYNNVVDDAGYGTGSRAGVVFFNETQTWTISNVDVANNIFINAASGWGVQRWRTSPNQTYFGANVQLRNNLGFNNGGGNTVETGAAGTGTWTSTGWVGGDPLFTSPSTGDYTLQAGSPALNVGLTLTDATPDAAGTSRPQGAGYDLGAFEFIAALRPPGVSTKGAP